VQEALNMTGRFWEGFTAEMTFGLSSHIGIHTMKRERRIFQAEGQDVQEGGMWRWETG